MIAADCEKEKCGCMRFSKFLSFLTLSGITDMVHIEQKFNKVHDKFKSQFFYWSIGATRKKLIIGFWYYEIPWHLLTIFMVAWLATFALHPSMFSAVSLMASDLASGETGFSRCISFFPAKQPACRQAGCF